jgi:hypothetical protein
MGKNLKQVPTEKIFQEFCTVPGGREVNPKFRGETESAVAATRGLMEWMEEKGYVFAREIE